MLYRSILHNSISGVRARARVGGVIATVVGYIGGWVVSIVVALAIAIPWLGIFLASVI